MGSIISRTSQLEPCIPVSVYTAPDILRELPFCPCVDNRDKIRESLEDFWISSYHDSRRCGVSVPVLQLSTSFHSVHMNGFAF